MDIGAMMRIMTAQNEFFGRHPKFKAFLKAVAKNPPAAGTIVDISFTGPDGTTLNGNLKITPEDEALLRGFMQNPPKNL